MSLPKEEQEKKYTFKLSPEELEPTGKVHFSRIDNTKIDLDIDFNKKQQTSSQNNNTKIEEPSFPVNYNMLRAIFTDFPLIDTSDFDCNKK
jgi:hypothetical protein